MILYPAIFFLVFFTYCLIAGGLAAVIFVVFCLPEEYGLAFMNPQVLHRTGKVNWFGAYFLGAIFS